MQGIPDGSATLSGSPVHELPVNLFNCSVWEVTPIVVHGLFRFSGRLSAHMEAMVRRIDSHLFYIDPVCSRRKFGDYNCSLNPCFPTESHIILVSEKHDLHRHPRDWPILMINPDREARPQFCAPICAACNGA